MRGYPDLVMFRQKIEGKKLVIAVRKVCELGNGPNFRCVLVWRR